MEILQLPALRFLFHRLPYKTACQLTASLAYNISARTTQILPVSKNTSIVACATVSTGTCLLSRCPEMGLLYQPNSRSLQGNVYTLYNMMTSTETPEQYYFLGRMTCRLVGFQRCSGGSFLWNARRAFSELQSVTSHMTVIFSHGLEKRNCHIGSIYFSLVNIFLPPVCPSLSGLHYLLSSLFSNILNLFPSLNVHTPTKLQVESQVFIYQPSQKAL
jgi:hypothetical protein